jgi:hypothetical protein
MMEEPLFEPIGYVDVELPPEEQAVATAVGFGGVAWPVPARLMRCNLKLFGCRAPVNFGVARDSQAERALWLREVAKEVTRRLPDRLILQTKKRSLIEKLLGKGEEIIEIERPYLFLMVGGDLGLGPTPYGGRPDILASDFGVWRKVVDSDISMIAEQMARRRAAQRSFLVGGRSVGSHEVVNAYVEFQLKRALKPNYTLTLLPVFKSEKPGLLAYLSLLKEFGLPRDEVMVPFSPNSQLGTTKSDIAFLTTFLLVGLVSQNPDLVTILERVRQRSPLAGALLKASRIPARVIKKKGKILWVLSTYSRKETVPEVDQETIKIIDRLISECYLEITEKIKGKPVAIFLYGPFQKGEDKEIEESYRSHYDCPILVGQGRVFGSRYLPDVYCAGLYTLDRNVLPANLAEATGLETLDEAPNGESHMKKGYETLSKLLGVDSATLFKRGDGG